MSKLRIENVSRVFPGANHTTRCTPLTKDDTLAVKDAIVRAVAATNPDIPAPTMRTENGRVASTSSLRQPIEFGENWTRLGN